MDVIKRLDFKEILTERQGLMTLVQGYMKYGRSGKRLAHSSLVPTTDTKKAMEIALTEWGYLAPSA